MLSTVRYWTDYSQTFYLCRSNYCITSFAYLNQITRVHKLTLRNKKQLECGPMPNVMVALPNIGGALCSTPQTLSDAHYWMPCSNAAKTRNPLKFPGVPQTRQQISAASRPKFTLFCGHLEDILLLNIFFRLSVRALVAKIQSYKVV